MGAIYPSDSQSGSLDLSSSGSSEDMVIDSYPASLADSPSASDLAGSGDFVGDDSENLSHPPDLALNVPSSPTASVSTTGFTAPIPLPPKGNPAVPISSLPTSSITTTATASARNSSSSGLTKIAATIGGVGGLVILILLGVIIMLYRRQKPRETSPPMHVHAHECQDMSRLEIDSRPYVSQLVGSPISELDSPSNAIHELPYRGHHISTVLRKMPSISTSGERYVGDSSTASAVSHDPVTPIDTISKF